MMSEELFREYSNNYGQYMRKWNLTIEKYVKSVGLSLSDSAILFILSMNESYTQKDISDILALPKQNINASITSFYKKGYVKLIENPKNRREKTIHLTDSGKKYADNFISKISKIEYEAMKKIGLDNMKIFNDIFKSYVESCTSEIEKLIAK